MNLVVVDVEADGPMPGEYSMVCSEAVVVEVFMLRVQRGFRTKPLTVKSTRRLPGCIGASPFTARLTNKLGLHVLHGAVAEK